MPLNDQLAAMSEKQPWKFFAFQELNFQFFELNFQFFEGNFKMSEPCVHELDCCVLAEERRTSSRHDRLLLGEQITKDLFPPLSELEMFVVKRTPSSRQKRARIKIDCYTYELKYIAAGVR
jgi:hypothetical protein